MTWVGLATAQDHRFSPYGLGIDRTDTPVADASRHATLPRGTLLFEFPLTGEEGADLIIGQSHTDQPARRGVELRLIPGGGISFVQTFGTDVVHAAVRYANRTRAKLIRVTLAWDATRQWARLAVERPGGQILGLKTFDSALPFLMDDLRALIEGGVTDGFIALSNDVVPLGPGPTLHGALSVPTGFGPRQLSGLKRGDTVFDPDGFSTPVLMPLRARFPALGSTRPVRLHAPFFGLHKDVVVAPTQLILLSGSRVEYNYGQEAVLIAAGNLTGSLSAHYEPCGPVIEYAQVLMPMAETLTISGLTFATPNIGRLRRDKVTLPETWYAQVPRSVLPEHTAPGFPVLNHFETSALVAELAA